MDSATSQTAAQRGVDRGYFQSTRPEMMAFLPQRCQRTLELGCGEGGFSASLRPGVETWGIERDAQAAAVAATRLHRVLHGAYDQVARELPDDYFDVVICNDVIEHVPDHDALLQSLRAKLVSGGHLVASIPNMRHFPTLAELLFKKDWRYRNAGLLDRTHLRFFTERSIRRTLEENGFRIEVLRGINQPRSSRKRLITNLIALLTLGYYADIRYQQFAVRARKIP